MESVPRDDENPPVHSEWHVPLLTSSQGASTLVSPRARPTLLFSKCENPGAERGNSRGEVNGKVSRQIPWMLVAWGKSGPRTGMEGGVLLRQTVSEEGRGVQEEVGDKQHRVEDRRASGRRVSV